MVLLRLTVKVPPPESVSESVTESRRQGHAKTTGKPTSFLMVIRNPEQLSLGELSWMITEKWAKLRPDAEPLEIKKLLDDEHDANDLDTDLTVADVFVDNGKAAADGLDQRGVVRVVQRPSRRPNIRYGSVVQDWNAVTNHYARINNRPRPPVPPFSQPVQQSRPCDPDIPLPIPEVPESEHPGLSDGEDNNESERRSGEMSPVLADDLDKNSFGPKQAQSNHNGTDTLGTNLLIPSLAAEVKSSLNAQASALRDSERARPSETTDAKDQPVTRPRGVSLLDRLSVRRGSGFSASNVTSRGTKRPRSSLNSTTDNAKNVATDSSPPPSKRQNTLPEKTPELQADTTNVATDSSPPPSKRQNTLPEKSPEHQADPGSDLEPMIDEAEPNDSQVQPTVSADSTENSPSPPASEKEVPRTPLSTEQTSNRDQEDDSQDDPMEIDDTRQTEQVAETPVKPDAKDVETNPKSDDGVGESPDSRSSVSSLTRRRAPAWMKDDTGSDGEPEGESSPADEMQTPEEGPKEVIDLTEEGKDADESTEEGPQAGQMGLGITSSPPKPKPKSKAKAKRLSVGRDVSVLQLDQKKPSPPSQGKRRMVDRPEPPSPMTDESSSAGSGNRRSQSQSQQSFGKRLRSISTAKKGNESLSPSVGSRSAPGKLSRVKKPEPPSEASSSDDSGSDSGSEAAVNQAKGNLGAASESGSDSGSEKMKSRESGSIDKSKNPASSSSDSESDSSSDSDGSDISPGKSWKKSPSPSSSSSSSPSSEVDQPEESIANRYLVPWSVGSKKEKEKEKEKKKTTPRENLKSIKKEQQQGGMFSGFRLLSKKF